MSDCRRMNPWDEIERLGLGLGANPEMIRKWRTRGVPQAWRVQFLTHPDGKKIPVETFSRPPGPRRFSERAA